MHIHLIGVAGTGMGSLAGLLKSAGHRVTGSDGAFYPPMGPALKEWGVETMEGYDAANLIPAPDRVVVGNVCRPDHVEAKAAIDAGLPISSFPGILAELFLRQRRPLVVAGTHGKTTTSTLLAYLLDRVGMNPGMLVGGIPQDFETSFRQGTEGGPFVVEGDEYDSAFFEKSAKFLQYLPQGLILTSVEHDHIDIYPDAASYLAAFEALIDTLPKEGLLVAWAGSEKIRALAERAECKVVYYALSGDDCGSVDPTWLACPLPSQGGLLPFELFIGGSPAPTVFSPLSGAHNIRNAVAAMALAAEFEQAPLSSLISALRDFGGIRRRQELRGVADGVRIYDDFAHHPTAVEVTLAGLRARHPEGKLVALFEPRSATASRNIHQDRYPRAFEDADLALIAPVGRPEIEKSERLDTHALAEEIKAHGVAAQAFATLKALERAALGSVQAGDTLVLMSNGAFGDLHDRLLAALAARGVARTLAERARSRQGGRVQICSNGSPTDT